MELAVQTSASPVLETVSSRWPAAIEFFNEVKTLAEAEGHHPDLHLTEYRTVQVSTMVSFVPALNYRPDCLRFFYQSACFGGEQRQPHLASPGGPANTLYWRCITSRPSHGGEA